MADPLASLAQRYAPPDLRAALAQQYQALMDAPAANVQPQAAPVPVMPNLTTQDFGRFRSVNADYAPGNVGVRGSYQSYDNKPAGWSAQMMFNSRF